jgi:hypothetical protein
MSSRGWDELDYDGGGDGDGCGDALLTLPHACGRWFIL